MNADAVRTPVEMISILIGFALLTSAQTPAGKAGFEVASIKVSQVGSGVRGGCHGGDSKSGLVATAVPLGRCVILDGRLSHLISIAYGLNSMQMLKAPATWIYGGDERFNVEAKAEDPKATEKQLLAMLQRLIEDRFVLKYHRENIEMPGLALVAAKNVLKLPSAKGVETSMALNSGGKPGPGELVSITLKKASLGELARVLTMMGSPTVDKTGDAGEYDFTLSWDENAGPTLSTALKEQLGLQVESQKVPASRFIIDSAERPTAN